MSVAERGAAKVEFGGELTIRTVAEAHQRLREAVSAGPAAAAQIAPDAAPDLAFVQLIQSARRTAREQDLDFSLTAPAEGALLQILERGGFLASAEDRAFWLKQTEMD